MDTTMWRHGAARDETFCASWVELETNHALTPDRMRNEVALHKDAAALEQFLSVLGVA